MLLRVVSLASRYTHHAHAHTHTHTHTYTLWCSAWMRFYAILCYMSDMYVHPKAPPPPCESENCVMLYGVCGMLAHGIKYQIPWMVMLKKQGLQRIKTMRKKRYSISVSLYSDIWWKELRGSREIVTPEGDESTEETEGHAYICNFYDVLLLVFLLWTPEAPVPREWTFPNDSVNQPFSSLCHWRCPCTILHKRDK